MGFTQAQINRYKQRFYEHGKHSSTPEAVKDTLPSLPVTAHETTQQQLVSSPRRPRTAGNVSSSVFENAGLPVLMREGRSSPQLILWRVRRRHCAGCGCTTVSVQPVASCDINLQSHHLWPSSAPSSSLHHNNAHARGALCDHGGHVGASSHTVGPQQNRHINTTSGRVVLPPSVYPSSASMTGPRPARSLLGEWLGNARQKLGNRTLTRKRLGLNWFRFDEKAAAAADGDLTESESLSRECCICLEEVVHGDKVSVLPCGHRFGVEV